MYKCAVLEISGDGMVYLCDAVLAKVSNPLEVIEIIDKFGDGFALQVKCDLGNVAILYCPNSEAINLYETPCDKVIAKIRERGGLSAPEMVCTETSTPLVPLVIFNDQQKLIDAVNIYFDMKKGK